MKTRSLSGVNIVDVIAGLNQGPFHALAQIYSSAQVRTALTPPADIDIASLDSGPGDSGEPNWAVKLLQPTLVLSGPAGTKVIAPAGEAPASTGVLGAALLAALVGLPFLIGVGVGRSTRRRP